MTGSEQAEGLKSDPEAAQPGSQFSFGIPAKCYREEPYEDNQVAVSTAFKRGETCVEKEIRQDGEKKVSELLFGQTEAIYSVPKEGKRSVTVRYTSEVSERFQQGIYVTLLVEPPDEVGVEPSQGSYVFTTLSGVRIHDEELTDEEMRVALDYIYEIASRRFIWFLEFWGPVVRIEGESRLDDLPAGSI